MPPISEKKIYIDTHNDAAVVVDKVIQAPTSRVVLSVPTGATFGLSVKDFQILNRESRTAGKEVIVESADARILELAALSDLGIVKATGRKKERSISDIVPRSSLPRKTPRVILKEKDVEEELKVTKKSVTSKTSPQKEAVSMPTPPFWEKSKIPEVVPKTVYPVFPPEMEGVIGKSDSVPVPTPAVSPDHEESERPPRSRWKLFVWGGVIFAVLVLGWFLGFRVFAKAEVTLELKKKLVQFEETVQAGTKIATPQISNPLSIPAEMMVKKQNFAETFPASGREKVSVKARGKLTVYNAYSSAPQPIVQNTRFVSPEGKVFRLDTKITIPGAKIENGKIVPSSIEVSVTADVAGESYNIPASSNWKIPGFEGTPKYTGFYGEAKAPMKGGFVGERAHATDADTAAAKEKIHANLEAALKGQMDLLIKDSFQLIDGASKFRIISDEITQDTQDETKMQILSEAELIYLVFDKAMLEDSVVKKAREIAKKELSGELRYRPFDPVYKNAQPNFNEGILTFGLTGTIEFEPDISPEKLKEELKGKSENEFRAYMLSLGDYIMRASLRIFPNFWPGRIPNDIGKIRVILE